jgi:hypothetical protein
LILYDYIPIEIFICECLSKSFKTTVDGQLADIGFTDTDMQYVDIKGNNIYYLMSGRVYSYDPKAIYQKLGCPVYITENGSLYVGYSERSADMFKIKDVPKFKKFLAQLMLLYKGVQ